MKLLRLLFWIVLLLLAVLGAQALLQDPGTVLVRFRGTDYTTTVAAAVVGVLVLAVVLWLLWALLVWPFAGWRRRRDRLARARRGEGLLAQVADDDPTVAGQARLAAARAAWTRGDHASARAHLQRLDDANAT